MPPDALAEGADVKQPKAFEAERTGRQALRIAFALAVGMTVLVATGSPLPFLAPLFAAQFLVASQSPPKAVQFIVMVLLIVIVGQGLALVTSIFGARPILLVPMLWCLYLGCFYTQATGRGGQAPFLVLVVAIMIPLMDLLHRDLGQSVTLLLAGAVVGGHLLAWAAHLISPDRDGATAVSFGPRQHLDSALHQSVANATILAAAVVLCLVHSALSSAVVIPITVASVLSQVHLIASRRAALGLIVVNVLGGLAASLAFSIVTIRPTLLNLFLVVFLVSLLLGGGVQNARYGKAFAGALTIFLTLLGLGITPLPTTTPEAFSTRIFYVCGAVLYALWASLLLWPRQSGRAVTGGSTAKAATAVRGI